MNVFLRDARAAASLEAIAAHARDWLFEFGGRSLAGRHRASERRSFPSACRSTAKRTPARIGSFVQARHVFSYCELGTAWLERSVAGDGPRQRRLSGRARAAAPTASTSTVSITRATCSTRAPTSTIRPSCCWRSPTRAGRSSAPDLFAAAEKLGDALEQAAGGMPHGGYFEGEIAVCPPYRQNPHMHLLECFIALHDASGAPRWRRDAEHLARLCARSFLHAETRGAARIFRRRAFTARGRGGPGGRARPLLRMGVAVRDGSRHGTRRRRSRVSDGLTAFARRHGLDLEARRRDQRSPDRRLAYATPPPASGHRPNG